MERVLVSPSRLLAALLILSVSSSPCAALQLRPLRTCRRGLRVALCAIEMALTPGLRVLDELVLRRRLRDRPNRIILVRHGQSEGNVNRSIYVSTPDNRVPLTPRGFEQSIAVGKAIRGIVGDESVSFFYSPYMRTRQTLLGVLQAWRGCRVKLIAEPNLREQDFVRRQRLAAPESNPRAAQPLACTAPPQGNFQDERVMEQAYEDRIRFGRLWYRFPSGEAGSDVYGRVGDLWETIVRRRRACRACVCVNVEWRRVALCICRSLL